MGFKGFNHGVNVIAYEKDGKKYGMCAAWCMLVDYDKAMMLLGGQSDTGNNIKEGDVIGISALSIEQKSIGAHFGSNHSLSFDKFSGVDYILDGTAILIPNARASMKGKVIEVIHTKENPEDNLVYVELFDEKENENTKFLAFEDFGE